MSYSELESALRGMTMGGFRYLETTGSTNDDALEWASTGAADFSLVMADTQEKGRGREGRKWHTLPGSGLAFSLVMRLSESERTNISRFSGLGALALVNALAKHDLPAQIKWPNDVLIQRKKVAGILVETNWLGDQVNSLILGLGVNVLASSLPPVAALSFPATSVESELGTAISRFDLLRAVMLELIKLRTQLGSGYFLNSWQSAIAFRNEEVQIWQGNSEVFTAVLLGLGQDGCLRVRLQNGLERQIHFGEVHLRPARL